MRLRLYILLCVFALVSSWAQDASAGDSPSPTGQSAYDIFGISPETEIAPAAGVPATGEAVPTLVQDAGAPIPAVPADEPAPVPAADPAAALPAGTGETAVVPDDADAALVNAAPGDAASSDAAPGDAAGNEEILMAEIMRLLAERDTLYDTINELRAENRELAEAAADAAYYEARSAELEAEIATLEEALADKERQLADADARLAETETKLAASGGDTAALDSIIAAKDASIAERDAAIADKDGTIAAMDERIAGLEQRLSDAGLELEAARAAEAAARAAATSATPATSTMPAAAPAADPEAVAKAERRIAEIGAERDAALAVRDAAIATRDASDAMRKATEQVLAETQAALAAAQASGTVVAAAPPATAPSGAATATAASSATAAAAAPKAGPGYLSGWRLDTSKFSKSLRAGFDGSAARMGSWKIAGDTAAQTDASQYFSRLEMPLSQGSATTLYRFKARSTGKGWAGIGLHIYVEDNKKKRGYGEGKSLLVWFTRDRAARGDDATYLQLYRSDDDVVMERMFDAELEDGIETWRLVEVVYDPGAEYIAISVDGVLRIVYRTFFGRDSGATVSLRTLGGGGAFSDFSAWTE